VQRKIICPIFRAVVIDPLRVDLVDKPMRELHVKLDALNAEMHPNGGTSLRDRLDQVHDQFEAHVQQHQRDHEEINQKLDELAAGR